jgi:RNA-directed DNA polymerase
MEESDIEGVATHGGPESCADVREGGGEVLTGVHVGGAIEPRNPWSRGADAVVKAEGNIGGGVFASRGRPPRGQRTQACVETPSARTGRSRRCPCLSSMPRPGWVRGVAWRQVLGRRGNAEAVIL